VRAVNLVFLHGRAAAGKLTTARRLSDLVGYPVFHNHVVVDMLTTMFPFGSEPFVLLREQFWLAVFAEAARHDCSLIFTFTPEFTVATGFAMRVRAAVDPAGGTVCFVRLRVSDAEQERRVTDPSRSEFHKLASVPTLRRIAAQPAAEQPPVDLDVDTDHSSAEASAALIASHFDLPRQVPQDRYPS
jgi:chloramphenicol 3-O-phosphotransferase